MLGIGQISTWVKDFVWETMTKMFPDLVVVGKTGFAHFRNIQDAITAGGLGPGGGGGGNVILIKNGTYYENIVFDVTLMGDARTYLIGMGNNVHINGGTTGNTISSLGNYGAGNRFINLQISNTPGGGNSYSAIQMSHTSYAWVMFCNIYSSSNFGILTSGTSCRNLIIIFNRIGGGGLDGTAIQLEGGNNRVFFNEIISSCNVRHVDAINQYVATALNASCIIGNIIEPRSGSVTNSVKKINGTGAPVVVGNQVGTAVSVLDSVTTGVGGNPLMYP